MVNDQVVWVDLTTVTEPDEVAASALEACGQLASPETSPSDLLVQHLTRRSTLVVIDNCEHVLGPVAELVAAVIAEDGESRVLATSREPLGIAGEITWRIPSLSVPDDTETTAQAVGESEAAALFVAQARANCAFDLDDASPGSSDRRHRAPSASFVGVSQ